MPKKKDKEDKKVAIEHSYYYISFVITIFIKEIF